MLDDIYNIMRSVDFDIFVDVFGGSGVVSLNLPFKCKIVFNDADRYIYNIFKVIQDERKRERLIEKMELAFPHESVFNGFKDVYFREGKPKDEVESAFMFIYLASYSYGGAMRNYGYFSSLSRGDKMNQAINGIKDLAYKLREWVILNRDYRMVIKKYDSERTFFYLDPPFLISTKNYKYIFSENDHRILSEVIKHVKGYYFLNLGGDLELMASIYGAPKIVKEYRNFAPRVRKMRKEGFWFNFELRAAQET
jgi:DNA adenine methylase